MPDFTGILGTSLTRLANIVLGRVPTAEDVVVDDTDSAPIGLIHRECFAITLTEHANVTHHEHFRL